MELLLTGECPNLPLKASDSIFIQGIVNHKTTCTKGIQYPYTATLEICLFKKEDEARTLLLVKREKKRNPRRFLGVIKVLGVYFKELLIPHGLFNRKNQEVSSVSKDSPSFRLVGNLGIKQLEWGALRSSIQGQIVHCWSQGLLGRDDRYLVRCDDVTQTHDFTSLSG